MLVLLRSNKGMTLLEIIVAMIIFAVGLLSMGMLIPYSTRKLADAKARTTSVALAQRFLDEVTSKFFDEKEADGTLDGLDEVTPQDMTPPGLLGPDGGESISNYDDIDDYNGLALDSIPDLNNFKADMTVMYCQANGDTTTGTQTFYKKITVKITPLGGNEKVAISTVISYKGQ